MWEEIERAIGEATGEPFTVRSRRPVAGGCINESLCVQGDDRRLFVKLNDAENLAMFEAEAAGLAAIRDSRSLRAPEPLAWGVSQGRSWLVLEFIAFSGPRPGSGATLGKQLAAMHRTTASRFGWERDNTIGSTPQPNAWMDSWIDFLRERRLRFQLELAASRGAPGHLLTAGERLLELLPALFAGYRPQPSLLHGDLWGGNWDTDENGYPVIFDPAVYFGDREADLAMTELFGGFDTNFYKAYDADWPRDIGYEARKSLYNLYHVLNHFNLFGGGYAHQAGELIAALLAELSPQA
jgi:fructosamine-3-kinase